jgi:predicted MPP superfamily phosphohydrolase
MTDGNAKIIEKPVLRFHPDGHFRILMISDFHGKPDFNPKLTAGIEALVAHTEPDFVMLGGDQLCGTDPETLYTFIERVMEPVQRRGIPWAHVYGNHDAEQPMTKEEMQPVYERFPLCLSEAGPEDISGVGNYCLTVLAADSDEPAYHLWAMDSHREYPDYLEKFGLPADTRVILPKHFGSGSVQASPMFDQVMWYYNE